MVEQVEWVMIVHFAFSISALVLVGKAGREVG